MRRILAFGFLAAAAIVWMVPMAYGNDSMARVADCGHSLNLEGSVTIEKCAPEDQCVLARSVLGDYVRAAVDKAPEQTLAINVYASPWHLYDGDMRIMTVEGIAKRMKEILPTGDFKRILLLGSWTGVAPTPNHKSIAQKLSDAVDGFPVTGMDGFLWIAKDGTLRTTRQAYTVRKPAKFIYMIHPGDEVMVSLVSGWYAWFEEAFIKERDAEGVRLAGAAWDIYMLCPDRALESFEVAAQLSDPIAAYNAAVIRLERGKEGDREAAAKLFKQAAKLGDKMAEMRLQEMDRPGK